MSSGASTSAAMRAISSSVRGASTKIASAPAAAYACARVGARDQDHPVAAARLDRGGDLLDHDRGADDLRAVVVAAAFGLDLILDVQGRGPGSGIGAHGAHDVERVAVTGVGVHDQRHRRDRPDLVQSLLHFGERHQTQVGIAHAARDRPAADVQRGKARGLGDPRRQPVVHPGRGHQVPAVQQGPQCAGTLRCLEHVYSPRAARAAWVPASRPKTAPRMSPAPPG